MYPFTLPTLSSITLPRMPMCTTARCLYSSMVVGSNDRQEAVLWSPDISNLRDYCVDDMGLVKSSRHSVEDLYRTNISLLLNWTMKTLPLFPVHQAYWILNQLLGNIYTATFILPSIGRFPFPKNEQRTRPYSTTNATSPISQTKQNHGISLFNPVPIHLSPGVGTSHMACIFPCGCGGFAFGEFETGVDWGVEWAVGWRGIWGWWWVGRFRW